MNNQQKLEFYRTYYKNLSPEPFTIEIEEGKIIISNILSKKSYKEGGQAKTWKQKYNKKYGYDADEGHTLKEISKNVKTIRTRAKKSEDISKVYKEALE